ncbi:hypothetical protein B0I35DRAFT_212858 [Stachybotrys elegans]|uniref:Uncharacterized protein n=1 Tax=Stachybotrys elegans TaxID=80388 RepID=A0A8K0SYA4_9HYPO|nr:hypothetical protein B0I35DRAFT_212858 [Stachybotrys elegans]
MRRDLPIHKLPLNWKGPLPSFFMDEPTQDAYDQYRELQQLGYNLSRARLWWPRLFIHGIVWAATDAPPVYQPGRNEDEMESVRLKFRPSDFDETGKALDNLRPDELEALRSLCLPPRFPRDVKTTEPLGPRGRLLAARVWDMLQDLRADSVFYDAEPKPFHQFMEQLNRPCHGPVKSYRFTEDEVMEHIESLYELGLLM